MNLSWGQSLTIMASPYVRMSVFKYGKATMRDYVGSIECAGEFKRWVIENVVLEPQIRPG